MYFQQSDLFSTYHYIHFLWSGITAGGEPERNKDCYRRGDLSLTMAERDSVLAFTCNEEHTHTEAAVKTYLPASLHQVPIGPV